MSKGLYYGGEGMNINSENAVNNSSFPEALVIDYASDWIRIKKGILEICEQNLPEYMISDEIEFVDDMPRIPRGKIDYRALENT